MIEFILPTTATTRLFVSTQGFSKLIIDWVILRFLYGAWCHSLFYWGLIVINQIRLHNEGRIIPHHRVSCELHSNAQQEIDKFIFNILTVAIPIA